MTNCISRRLLRPPLCWTSWRRLRPKSARNCPRFFPFCRTRFKYRMTIQTAGRSLPPFHFFDAGIAGNLCGVGHLRETGGARGQKQFGNRLSYSTRTASAFFELPSATFSFTGVAGKAGDARSLCGAACARSELCSLCYAEKHCRFCYHKPKCSNPHSLRRVAAQGVGGNVQSRRFFFAVCLRNTFSLADTPHSVVSALLVPVRCTLIFASQCPTPLCGVGHWGGGEKLGV